MIQTTPKSNFRRLYAANVGTLGAITDPAPAATEPTAGANGVFGLSPGDGDVFNAWKFSFFGAGNSGDTFTASIYKWELTRDAGGTVVQWKPKWLMTVLCTLGSTTGSDGGGIGSTNKYVTTITVVSAMLPSSSYVVMSPGSNRIAELDLDPGGSRVGQVLFGTTATATSANGEVAGF